MSHVINYITAGKDANKNEILAGINEEVVHEDWLEGGSYDPRQMKWHDDIVYKDKIAAQAAIEHMDNGFYDDHAVLFHDTDGLLEGTKRMKTLKDRIDAEREKRSAYIEANDITKRKSASITCPTCNSRITLKYYRGTHFCPVCGHDLYSETVKNRLTKFEEKINGLEDELKEERRKAAANVSAKAPIKWLIKYEYHV